MPRPQIALLSSCLAVFACGPSDTSQPESAATQTKAPAAEKPSPEEPTQAARAASAIRDGALVLDVRTSEEFSEGAIEGAKLVPHDEIEARIDEIREWAGDSDATIVTYCRAGRRAEVARTALQDAGFSAVINGGGHDELVQALAN